MEKQQFIIETANDIKNDFRLAALVNWRSLQKTKLKVLDLKRSCENAECTEKMLAPIIEIEKGIDEYLLALDKVIETFS